MKIKKNKYSLGLLVQIVVLFALICALFIPKMHKQISPEELVYFNGICDNNGNAYADNNISAVGYVFVTENLKLGYGTYEVKINYTTDSDRNLFYISTPDVMNGVQKNITSFITDTVVLESSMHEKTLEFLIKKSSDNYVLSSYYMGEGALTIENIEIRKTNAGIMRLFILVTVLFLSIDFVIYSKIRIKNGKISQDKVVVFFALASISLFASIPFMLNYILAGHDYMFHLLRIEGIKEGLKMGQFPVKVQPNWLHGNGYAASVFYGDILLYIPAILRLCGFTVYESYNIFVFLVNISTTIVTYYCLKRVGSSDKAAIVASAMYTLSIYRFIDLLSRSSVGEYSAMVFLPFVVTGMYEIFTKDIKDKEYKNVWLLPVIGLTGILNTHILTCEMTAGFIVLLCIICIKKVFRKDTFIALVKVVVITILLNLSFLVPFLDYMLRDSFKVTHSTLLDSGIQDFGAFLGQILVPLSTSEGLANPVNSGMSNDMPACLGMSFITAAVIMIYILVCSYDMDAKKKKFARICLVFGGLGIWFSLYFFPWDTFQRMNKVFASLIKSIQFPWRFLVVSCVMFTFVAALAMDKLKEKNKLTVVALVLMALTVFQSSFFMSDIMNNKETTRLNTSNSLDTGAIIGAEYLPYDSDFNSFNEAYVLVNDNLNFELISRYNNYIEFSVSNTGSVEEEVLTSNVYYRGYVAYDMATGQKLTVRCGNGSRVAVVIEPGYSGTVCLKFENLWYWRIADLVSFITFVTIIAYFMRKKVKSNAVRENTDRENTDRENTED